MTNNTAPLLADKLRQQILKALKRDWLVRLQANHPIDTVETLDPVANDFAESQLVEYEQQALEDAERRGRIASIDEYLHKCDTLGVEPTRRSLELFQQGQHTALAMLKLQPNTEGKDDE